MVRRGLTLLAVVAFFVALAGCSALDTEPANRGSVMQAGVFGDLRARQPAAVDAPSARGIVPVGGSGATRIYGPDGSSATTGGTAGGPADDGGAGSGAYRLNFENAEIKDVVHAVLGDTLGLNYTLSPDVSGKITVASARPVGRGELLATLETVLAAQGYSMTRRGEVYAIAPSGPGGGAVDVGLRSTPGYGVSIVPLSHVSVATVSKLLAGFVADADGIRIDSTRNALVVSGPSAKRAEVARTALSFDGDWMAGQSVGIFELKQASPDAVSKELERVFDTGGAGSGVIQFQPIQRLKAVLAVSKNTQLIARAGSWARRLDGAAPSQQRNIFVYRPQYRDATELAKVLAGLFGAPQTTSAAPTSQTGGTTPSLGGTGGASGQNGQGGQSGSAAGGTSSLQNSGGGLNEAPIDDVTGASGGSGDTGGQQAAPGVIDLTSKQGGEGPTIRISADVANNTVVTYTDPETYAQVLAALQRLDAQPLQVAIQATIAEVTLNDKLSYGVQYYLKNTNLGFGETSSVSFPGAGLAAANVGDGFNFILGSASNPSVIVSALNNITDVEILSTPSLVVMENQTANLQVGNDVPVEVGTTTTDGGTTLTQVEYRSTGIILKVTPRIGDNGAVTMKIAQEISDVTCTTCTLNPTFTKRAVSSQISVVSGQTVVLAGLISTQKSNERQGLPLLSRLTGIGDIAGTTAKNGKRSELVVLIRPTVIHSSDDAQTVAEELRSRMWAISTRETKAR